MRYRLPPPVLAATASASTHRCMNAVGVLICVFAGQKNKTLKKKQVRTLLLSIFAVRFAMVGFEVFVPLAMSRMNADSTVASCGKRVRGEVREENGGAGDAMLARKIHWCWHGIQRHSPSFEGHGVV